MTLVLIGAAAQRVSSATTSFNALASRRSSVTSSAVAARQCLRPGASCRPPEIPSTSDNRGSGQSPRGGTARRYCPRRVDPKGRCESSPLLNGIYNGARYEDLWLDR